MSPLSRCACASRSLSASPSILMQAALDEGPHDGGNNVAAIVRTRARGSPAMANAVAPETSIMPVETASADHGSRYPLSDISEKNQSRAPQNGQPRQIRIRRRSPAVVPGGYTINVYRIPYLPG